MINLDERYHSYLNGSKKMSINGVRERVKGYGWHDNVTDIGGDYVITENHKVYINQIYITGNTRTRENVIRRQLRVFPGDVYNQDLIARSYREVMMLNYFANAAPNILPLSEDKINISMDESEQLHPEQSTTAIVALHPVAKYFGI